MISMMSSPLTRTSTRLQHNINSWINIQTWTPKEHRAVSHIYIQLPMWLNSMHARPILQATTAWVTFSHWHKRARKSRLVWGCRSRVQAAAIPRAQKFQVGSIYLKCSQAWSMITKAVSKPLRYPRIHRMGAISSASPISRTKSTSAWAPSSSSASSSPTRTHKKQQKAACKASKAKSRNLK